MFTSQILVSDKMIITFFSTDLYLHLKAGETPLS